MSESKWEPSAESVEAEAEKVMACFASGGWYKQEAVRILRRQHERERQIMCWIESARRALRCGETSHADNDLKDAQEWHAALDAPKVPSLLEAAKAMLGGVPDDYPGRWLSLKAAVEREESKR